MPRYINVEWLMEKIKEREYPLDNDPLSTLYGLSTLGFFRILEEAPIVSLDEVRSVVRCGECKHTERDGTDDPAIYCKVWDRWEMPEDGFCYKGAKMEVANDE